MRKKLLLTMLLTLGGIATARDVASVLDVATKALGDPSTIQYSGSGAVFTLGQNVNPAKPWPRVELKSFSRAID